MDFALTHKIELSEIFGMLGQVRVIKSKSCSCDLAKRGLKCRHKIGGKYRPILSIGEWKNLVVSNTTGSGHGRYLIMKALKDGESGLGFSLKITHGEIGTGTNTPQNTDTGLQTPSVRVALDAAGSSLDNNVLTLRFFMSDATLPNGTYYEFGCYINGSSGLGTGQLFERALFSTPYQKASGEDTTEEVQLTLNAV